MMGNKWMQGGIFLALRWGRYLALFFPQFIFLSLLELASYSSCFRCGGVQMRKERMDGAALGLVLNANRHSDGNQEVIGK